MIIYDKAGSILLDIEVDDTSVRYKAIKGENSLTLKFSLAEHVEVPLGSYCVFKGETYSLMMPEDLTMNHRRSFEYTLVMYSEDAKAKRIVFINPVDGRIKFPLTAKPIEHLQMFVDNMNMRDTGWSVGECPDHAEITLSYNGTKCHDALVQLADELELDYWFNGKVVNIGKIELNKDKPLPLSYGGDGEGLKPNIRRTNYSDALPIEILYVQGGSTNIDPSRYRVPENSKIGSSELLLPASLIIGYDGTHFDDEDGFDISKARYYKTDAKGYSVSRSDKEIVNHSEDSLDCSDIEPTREETVVSVVEVNKDKHFYDILFASDVDYSQYVIGGENATVIFQSGMLAGKEFDLATDENGNLICKKEEDLWRVEIVPQDIDGITMPDVESGYVPVADDTFKVFGIQLPDEYMRDAEMNMLRYAVKHFYANEDVQYTVSGELDEIYAKKNWDSIKDKLTLGSYISFSDKSFQEEPLLIRITGIKDYVNKPYSPQLEISNASLSGTLVGALNRIENQEVETEDKIRQAIGFSKRRWRDAKETLSMLTGAVANFTEGISPITVETMSMLIGDERLQFIFTASLASDVVVDLMYSYDLSTGTFSVQSGFIKHMTLGIDSISPVHADEEYKRWSVAEVSEALNRESGYYLYAKVSKDGTSGAFELHDTIQTDTEEWYYLLVGILNSEYNGSRSFASMYGYTEVRPGQITTDNIRSSDGNTWLDLLKGILHLNNMAGVSGVKNSEKGDKSIAAWFGGLMQDLELDKDATNPARSVIRHDGTGYFANGLFSWDKDKGINLGSGQLKINYDGSVDFGGNIRIGSTGEETLDSLLTIVAKLAGTWSLDENGNIVADKQVIIKNNLIVSGDTASGGEGEDITVGLDEQAVLDLLEAKGYVTEEDIAGLIPDDYVNSAELTEIVNEINAKIDEKADSSALQNLQNEVDNIEAVLGMDEEAQGIINTWNEVKAFLDGYSSSDDLATILSSMNADIAKRALKSELEALGLIVDGHTSSISTINGSINAINGNINTLSGRVGTNEGNISNLLTRMSAEETVTNTYKDWWFDLKPLIVKDTSGNIVIKTNLIVEGDTASLASGTDEPSGSGGITLTDVAGYLNANDYVNADNAEELGMATQEWVNNKKYVTGITVNDVTLKPSNGIINIGSISGGYTKDEINDLLGDYLPLAGGKLTGDVQLKGGTSICDDSGHDLLYCGGQVDFGLGSPAALSKTLNVYSNDILFWAGSSSSERETILRIDYDKGITATMPLFIGPDADYFSDITTDDGNMVYINSNVHIRKDSVVALRLESTYSGGISYDIAVSGSLFTISQKYNGEHLGGVSILGGTFGANSVWIGSDNQVALTTDAEAAYLLVDGSKVLTEDNYSEFISGSGSIDLSDYYTKTEVDNTFLMQSSLDNWTGSTNLVTVGVLQGNSLNFRSTNVLQSVINLFAGTGSVARTSVGYYSLMGGSILYDVNSDNWISIGLNGPLVNGRYPILHAGNYTDFISGGGSSDGITSDTLLETAIDVGATPTRYNLSQLQDVVDKFGGIPSDAVFEMDSSARLFNLIDILPADGANGVMHIVQGLTDASAVLSIGTPATSNIMVAYLNNIASGSVSYVPLNKLTTVIFTGYNFYTFVYSYERAMWIMNMI